MALNIASTRSAIHFTLGFLILFQCLFPFDMHVQIRPTRLWLHTTVATGVFNQYFIAIVTFVS